MTSSHWASASFRDVGVAALILLAVLAGMVRYLGTVLAGPVMGRHRHSMQAGVRRLQVTGYRAIASAGCLAVAGGLSGQVLAAARVDDVVVAGNDWLVAQTESQARVDTLGDQKRDLAEEYRTVLREIEGLQAYNRQLQRQLQLQQGELATLDESIGQATVVDRQVLPLMLRMAGALQQFVTLDLPFLPQERTDRLTFVQEAIDRVDVPVPEKFRQVLEAYLVELEYGRTIEAYTGIAEIDGQELEVDFLRVGRIGLFYQTLDGARSGRWDAVAGGWEAMPAADRNPIRDAIKVARKLSAPDLLTLPLPTATAAR